MESFDLRAGEIAQKPYGFFAMLRDRAPVSRLEPPGFVAVARYEDVTRVLRSPDVFSNSGYRAAQPPELHEERDAMPPSIVQSDPPQHAKLRALVSKAFTPKVIAALEPRIREVTRRLLKERREKDVLDVVPELSVPLPVIVIAELLGVEVEHQEDFKRWSDDLVQTLGMVDAVSRERLVQSRTELLTFFQRALDRRRREPGRDLLSLLQNAELDGARLTDEEVLSFATTLLIAGNETTTSLLGNALVALTDHPEQLEAVARDRRLVPAAIEETLRFYSPAQTIFRQAKRDVEVAGTTIPEGSVVLPLIASANRDDRRFPDGDTFDVRRDTSGHIAFGLDIHFCMGAALARLEGRVVLEELFADLGPVRRVESDVAWTPSFFMRAPQRLVLERAS